MNTDKAKQLEDGLCNAVVTLTKKAVDVTTADEAQAYSEAALNIGQILVSLQVARATQF